VVTLVFAITILGILLAALLKDDNGRFFCVAFALQKNSSGFFPWLYGDASQENDDL
jgi:hypothetical protein